MHDQGTNFVAAAKPADDIAYGGQNNPAWNAKFTTPAMTCRGAEWRVLTVVDARV